MDQYNKNNKAITWRLYKSLEIRLLKSTHLSKLMYKLTWWDMHGLVQLLDTLIRVLG